MRYIFISSVCSRIKYEEIFLKRKQKFIDPSQKFLNQLLNGMVSTEDEIVACSALPVSASSFKEKTIFESSEYSDGITYIYPGFRNGLFKRYSTLRRSFKKTIQKLLKSKKRSIVICDPLCVEISKICRKIAKKNHVPCVAIVTDIPYMATKMKENVSLLKRVFLNFYEYMAFRDLVKYDGYIELTNYMDSLINKNNKPHIVIEGSVSSDEAYVAKKKNENKKNKVVIYAGGVYEKYGLKNLISALRG